MTSRKSPDWARGTSVLVRKLRSMGFSDQAIDGLIKVRSSGATALLDLIQNSHPNEVANELFTYPPDGLDQHGQDDHGNSSRSSN